MRHTWSLVLRITLFLKLRADNLIPIHKRSFGCKRYESGENVVTKQDRDNSKKFVWDDEIGQWDSSSRLAYFTNVHTPFQVPPCMTVTTAAHRWRAGDDTQVTSRPHTLPSRWSTDTRGACGRPATYTAGQPQSSTVTGCVQTVRSCQR